MGQFAQGAIVVRGYLDREEPERTSEHRTEEVGMGVLAGKVLLATDGSPEAERAARMAAAISRGLGSELHVVHAAPLPNMYAVPGYAIYAPALLDEMREAAEAEGRETLDEQVGKMKDAGDEVARTHLRVGLPEARILDLAEELDALVVLGSRGFGPVRRAVVGSVSDSVVRHAHCPVLVVREGRDREDSLAPASAEEQSSAG